MFAPGIQQGFRIPRFVFPFFFAITAIAGVILAWAAFDARPLAGDSGSPPAVAFNPAAIRSVAYTVPEGPVDALYVQPAGATNRRFIASFDNNFSLHARGSASPGGERIAILHVAGASDASQMSLIDIVSGERRDAALAFDHLSSLAWAPDGRKLAATHSSAPDEIGRATTLVLEVNATTGAASVAARFELVLQVHPVGYSADGQRLFIVVIDQSGSALWEQRGGQVRLIGHLSAGRTRDWRLSPDGARLAFIDILSAGAERTYAGKVVLTATGNVTAVAASDDQLGAVWQPRSDVPAFGGPGGTLRLASPADARSYVVPVAWSPDGEALVASVHREGAGSVPDAAISLELVWPDRRERLTDTSGADFLGWVRNLD